MANCFIPNSTPATGRTSTTSSRRSKRLNSASSSFLEASRLPKAIGPWTLRFLNAQRLTLNAQHSIHRIERSTLGVGRWTFFSFRRVKGARWPSRSSKPSSPRKWRGRFDSYPLREFESVPVAVSLCETRASPTGRRLQRSLVKGGELRCPASRFVN
jgi:hypothetical protein